MALHSRCCRSHDYIRVVGLRTLTLHCLPPTHTAITQSERSGLKSVFLLWKVWFKNRSITDVRYNDIDLFLFSSFWTGSQSSWPQTLKKKTILFDNNNNLTDNEADIWHLHIYIFIIININLHSQWFRLHLCLPPSSSAPLLSRWVVLLHSSTHTWRKWTNMWQRRQWTVLPSDWGGSYLRVFQSMYPLASLSKTLKAARSSASWFFVLSWYRAIRPRKRSQLKTPFPERQNYSIKNPFEK